MLDYQVIGTSLVSRSVKIRSHENAVISLFSFFAPNCPTVIYRISLFFLSLFAQQICMTFLQKQRTLALFLSFAVLKLTYSKQKGNDSTID
jgi:hypothetical protein